MTTYNKLVRDKISKVIRAAGKECEISVVSGKEKTELLEKKLMEEVNEFMEAKNLEELADIMEVLCGLAEDLGFSEEELVKVRCDKRRERGGFNEGIVLKRVY